MTSLDTRSREAALPTLHGWDENNTHAPKGWRWVCEECGKTSRDKYGIRPYSRGWNTRCYLHAKLYREGQLVYAGSPNTPAGTLVKEIKEDKP